MDKKVYTGWVANSVKLRDVIAGMNFSTDYRFKTKKEFIKECGKTPYWYPPKKVKITIEVL